MGRVSYRIVKKEENLSTNALAPVIGYDPWALRTIESFKHSIASGVPVLIRVHSAAEYPIVDEEVAHEMDMESHCVLLVGYNDDFREFDAVDPWNNNWGGRHGGIEKFHYSWVPITCVNCSADKGTRISTITHSMKVNEMDGNASVTVELGFFEPLGYIMDKDSTRFEEFDVCITYMHGEVEKKQTQTVQGQWYIGEKAALSFPIEKSLKGELDIEVDVYAKLACDRPYPFNDSIHMKFTESIMIDRMHDVVTDAEVNEMAVNH